MVQAAWSKADLERARLAFETSDRTCKAIASMTGISQTTLYRHARTEGWQRCEAARGPSPALLKAIRQRRTSARARRGRILQRLWALLDRHLAAAEARAGTKAGLAAGDREMRVIGGIAKTLRECQLLENARRKETPPPPPKETSSDDTPAAARSPDEIREAFATLVSDLFDGGHPEGGPDLAS